MSQSNQRFERPTVAPDEPVPADQAAVMSAPPEHAEVGEPRLPASELADLDDYEPVDPDPEAVIDEVTGGPVDAEDADEAYPHEARGGVDEETGGEDLG